MAATGAQRAEPRLFSVCVADEKLLDKLPDWLRPDQVRKVLGDCSRETVRQLRLRGQIQCRDFRGPDEQRPTWRFYKESVRKYLHDRPTGTTEI